MLPSKGYFNSLECPFYLSSTKCLRPYCHFKHPKRDMIPKESEQVENLAAERSNESNLPPAAPVAEKPVIPPVKHIPIAYIPTKPSAISVNTKKPKSVYIPSSIDNSLNRSSLPRSVYYDPLSVVDSSEKTYSRYSYEKGHDSGDEIMENHKNLIETNISKYDDGSKSGYDEETDDYPEEAQFSQDEEDDNQMDQCTEKDEGVHLEIVKLENDKQSDIVTKSSRCKKKMKYNQIERDNSSLDNKLGENAEKSTFTIDNVASLLTKKIKIGQEDNIDFIKNEEHSPILSRKNKLEDDDGAKDRVKKKIKLDDSVKVSEAKKPEKKICKYKDKKHLLNCEKHLNDKYDADCKESSEPKKVSSSSKKHSPDVKKQISDKKHSKSDDKHSGKSPSSHHNKHSDNDKKHESSNKNKSDSKRASSESSKKHSSGDKKKESDIKKHSSEKSIKTSSNCKKHNSDDKYGKKSQSKEKHSSGNKKLSSDENKKSNNPEKVKSKSKSRVHSDHSKKHSSSKSKSNEKRSSSDSKKRSDKKRDSHSRSNKSSGNGKSKERSSTDKHKSNIRRRSDSSDSVVSSSDKKETILISDSSDSEASIKSYNRDSTADVDDILGFSDVENNHDVSESDGDVDEYDPMDLQDSKGNLEYRPTNLKKNDIEDLSQNFKAAPTFNSDDSFRPVQTSKIRIAHVPNVSSLLSAKTMINSGKRVPPTIKKLVSAISDINTPRIVNSGLPQSGASTRPRPQITLNLDSVIAVSIRQPGLNNIYDELIKFVSYDEAYKRAIEEETEICNVATNPQSYRNRIALCILRIRKSKGAVDIVKKERITSNSKPDYTYGLTLYECFSKYLLQPEDYVLHGYPLELPGKPGCVYIDKSSYFRNKYQGPTEGPFRKCLNCGLEYAVDEETGIPLTKNDCHHHWGKPIGTRQGKIYTCCKSEVGSEPCHISLYHITETKNDDCLEGYVRTRPYPSDEDPNKAGIYAIDCEMCFTTQGRDIVRASLLGVDNEIKYDVLIKPKFPILDYCTRFSGITEEKLASVTTTLKDVQKFLLKLLNDKTILVGHSLENDLKALKLIHYNVVDTSIMFPHKEGFPVKCALRTLCTRYLGQAIQTGEQGHDSLEDARASLELVLYKVKEDAKVRKPRVVKQLKHTK